MANLYPGYSVLMSLYKNEDPRYFEEAMSSICDQTVLPSELVLVIDGPIPNALVVCVERYERDCPFPVQVVSLKNNVGLGQALSVGSTHCKFDLIARMDTDDYSYPNRMELTLDAFLKEPDLALVGGQAIEFVKDINHPVSAVRLPEKHEDIVSFSKKRDPFRHPAVTMRKEALLDVGNYRGGFLYYEDWDLFNRFLQAGYKTKNLSDTILAIRVNPDFYGRRGGIEYLRHTCRFKYSQYKVGYFSFGELVGTLVPHIVVGIMPNRFRSFVYKKFLRNRPVRK